MLILKTRVKRRKVTQLCQPVLATAHAQIVIVPYIATVTANTIIHTPAFLVVTSILTWCRIVSGYFRLQAKHSTFQDKKIRVKKSSSTSLGRKKKTVIT